MSSTHSLILNVDDDDAGRYAKSRILERAGYRVLDAATGRDALRLIRDARPHLVVLDVGLPDMSGIDVCRQIKADSAMADTLVLQVSASCVQPRDRVLGLEGGADVYLIEPVEAMELLAAVKALLRLYDREEEKRLLVAQLQEAQRSLSLAQRGSNSGVWDWDLTTGSTYVSPEYRMLYGLSGDEQVSYDTWLTLVYADDRQRVDEYGRRLFEAGSDYQIEFRILHPLKGIRWLSGMGTLTRDEEGRPVRFSGINMDVTDRKQAEEALRESERRFLAELKQRVEQRTNELVGSRERLRALAAELTLTEQRERQRLAGELHDYLAQLLVFGRIKMSQLKRTESSAATNTVAHEVDESLRQALTYTRSLVAELSPPILHDFGLVEALKWLGEDMRRHDMTVVLRCEFKQVSLAEDQAVLLFQSVRELLLNVSKHAGTAHALVSVLVEQGSLHVHIVDEGRGFDPTAVGATNASATFGLFSIKERMSAMGGRFELASTPERGTRATLILPLAGVEKSSELGVVSSELEDRSSELTESGTPGNSTLRTQNSELQQFKVRVLLADDHAMLRQGLRTVLEGYADIEVVGEAADGEQAVLLARSLQPEVVVMDINMPAVDGIEATRQLKLEQPTITVIGLSVHNNRQVEQAMREAGATAFLTKEAAVEQLYQTIQTALR